MPAAPETPAAALGRLYKAPRAPLGTDWLSQSRSGLTDTLLQAHMSTVGPPTLPAARTQYGHFRTEAQMKGTPSTIYWSPDKDLLPALRAEAALLNPAPTELLHERLPLLQQQPVGAAASEFILGCSSCPYYGAHRFYTPGLSAPSVGIHYPEYDW